MPTLVSTGQFTIVDVNDGPITNLTPPSELTSVVASPMGGWTLYSGTVSNSSIVNDQVGPNGEYPRILRTAGDGVSIAGWYSGYRYWFKVDITKAYVHYCWIRRRSATSANLYLGWTNTANYIDNLAGVNDSNPYFISGHNPTIADKWYLCVGVIWPAGYGAGDTGLAGMYDPHTGVRVYDGAEWRHNVAATQQYIRFGFYNNVTAQATTDGYDFLPVGTYCMDGTHPTKEAIMNTVPAAMTAALSKETYVFPADNVGAVSSYSGSGTQIRVYQGAAELTYDGVGTAKGTWRISSTTPTNITVGSITDSGTFATVADHSGVAAGTDTSTIVYNIAGKTLTGADFTLVKTQTFAKAKAGTNGTNGVRTAVLEMYQWAASAPSSFPSGSSTYTWSNGTFTAPATTNGWTLTPGTPSAGQTLYVVRQVFTDSLTSATSSVTWSASSSLPSGAAGTNGTNGQRVGVLEVYQWAVSAPTLYPTGTSTYTWSNGSFTAPSTPNGWSLTPGSPAVGQTLWAISTRVSDNLTSSTSTATWSSTSPYAVGYAGTNGTNGIAGERGSKEFFATGSAWSDATADSAITVAGLTKVLLDQVTISNGTSFAESRFWNGTAWAAISQVINGNLLVNGTVGANALVAGTILANVFNVGDTKFKLDGAAKGAGKGALIVTNGTNDILTLGYLDGTNIGLSLKDASGNVVMQTSTPAGGGATANSFSPSISNNAITVDASGILQGAGTANVVVANNQIAVNASGQVTGIGTGNNTTVANSQIAVNASGQVTGIGTGNNTTVANSQIAVNASGQVTGIGTGNNTTVANNQISVSGGQISGIGTGNGSYVVKNLQDSSSWKPDVTPPWPLNGLASENSIVWGTGPKGGNIPLWKCTSSGDGNADGGWDYPNSFKVDVNKTYRFMVPVKMETITGTSGSAYLGIQSNTVCNLNTTTPNSNPYFFSTSRTTFIVGRWYLIVGYVYPSGSTGATNTGAHIYDMTTGSIVANGNNYCWNSTTTQSGSRAYMYYATTAGNIQYFAPPVVEVVDGSESSINELLQASAIFNQNITISSGAIQGIGSGTGTMVSNNAITVDANGILQGTGTAGTVVANNKITINSNGTLGGAGAGQVTIGGLGYTGDLNATSGGGVIPNSSSFSSGWTIGANITLTTGGSGDPAPKYLRSTSVAGTANSAIIDLPASATKLWFYYQSRSSLGTTASGFITGNIYYYRADGTYLTAVTISTNYPNTTTWNGTYFLQEFTIPAGAAKIQMYVSLQPTSGNWVDVALPNIFTIQPGATLGAVAGTNLRRSNNVVLNDGDVVTSLGTAASIANQAATATSSDFSVITGATKPANNATVGATIGTNLSGQFTSGNVPTFFANASIGAAQIGSIQLVGTNNFSVKSSASGARMELDSQVIKIYDANNVLRVQLGIW